MAKKKKKNPLVAALKRSLSGWGKAVKYMNDGKWAEDISKAVHRSGAGKRAQQRARVAPKRSAAVESFDRSISKAKEQVAKKSPTKKQRLDAVEAERVKTINARIRAIKKETKAIATAPQLNGNQLMQESIRSGAADAASNSSDTLTLDDFMKHHAAMGKLSKEETIRLQKLYASSPELQNENRSEGLKKQATIRQRVANAQKSAAKQVTDVSAHNRQGSKGVKGHERKLNPKEQRAATAKQLLQNPFVFAAESNYSNYQYPGRKNTVERDVVSTSNKSRSTRYGVATEDGSGVEFHVSDGGACDLRREDPWSPWIKGGIQ